MEIICPNCGETCEINVELKIGQHVICPFCNAKFSYGEQKTTKSERKIERETIMAVCPYCGFGESVDKQFSGLVGECSKCGGEYTILPNTRGIPFQQQSPTINNAPTEKSSSDGVLGFLLGFFFTIIGIIVAALIDKKRFLKGAIHGLITHIVILVIFTLFIIVFSFCARAFGKKTAGATEYLSTSEKYDARSAAESIDVNSIKNLGE